MAYTGTYKARLGKMIDTSPPVVWTLPLGETQTFVAGEFVFRSSGYVVTCEDAPDQILGIAKAAAPSGTYSAGTYEIPVLVATAMTAYKIVIHSDTGAQAVIEATDLCKRVAGSPAACFDLYHIAASGVWYVHKDNHASDAVEIQQFIDPLGTLNGKVLITINHELREVT